MKSIVAILLTVVLSLASGAAQCDDFPSKPARIVVPIGPGSSMDIVGRVLAQKLNENWGEPVIVDNRAGAGGNGSSDQMAGELFKLLAGVDIVHVPYKSGPQAQNDLIGGQISIYLGGIPVQLPMIKAGKVKPLGTSGLKRSPALPEVPTIAEAGVPGYEVDVWYGLFAPRATPRSVVARIASDVSRIVKAPDMRERLNALGVESAGTLPAEFKAQFSNEIEKWARVVKAAGISMD